MKAFLYGIALQFKMDIRSKTMLITCYAVPLIFFAFMSSIFTWIDPNAANTLIPSMSVFVITMSAFIGLPPSLAEIYGGNVKKVFKANGVPLYLGVITQFIASFIHIIIVCLIIFTVAPFAFNAKLPPNIPIYFCNLIALTLVSLSIGCVLGLIFKAQDKTTMAAMLLFLPSIMLSGIMFPSDLLPVFMTYIAYIFPATLGYRAMIDFRLWYVLTLIAIFIILCIIIALLLKRSIKN